MAREPHRPTKTNYQDYLFDFSNVDFSQYAGQGSAQGPDVAAQQTDEPGFLARLGNTALAIGEGLTMLPGGIVGTVRDTWHGGDIDVTDTEAMRDREERARQQAAYVQKYQGKAFDGVADAMISMPYSLATMGASLGAGIPATMAAGPVVGGATGMAASGAVAYRASKQNFMENMLAETTKLLGRTPTQDEWDRVAQEFDSEATQYGLWEAGPEALSNLFMTKLLGPLGKRVFSGGIGNAAKRVAGLYGEEMATETATQMGQGSIEADLGLRDEAPGVLQALGEVAPATFWQTTLMAGGKKGLDLLSRRYDRGQQVEEAPAPDQQEGSQNRPEAPAAGPNNTAPASDFGSLSGPEWNAPEARIDEAMWNREASARGWNHLRTDAPKPDLAFIPGDPFTDPAAAQDTEDFVRRFEEAEQAVEEDTTGMAQSLDQGKTVDLLAPPPQQEDSPAPGRPSAPVTSAPAVHAPAPGPDSPRRASPLLSPQGNDRIPAQPDQQDMAAPVFPAEPSPLPAGGVLSQMGQAGPQRQPPVTAVPTQAQVLNTQATPRADTTAPAEGLGMPAPDAIPREAQPAPQPVTVPAPSSMPQQSAPASVLRQGPSPVTIVPQTEAAVDTSLNGADISRLSRAELLRLLPDGMRAEARRMPTEKIRRLVDQQQKNAAEDSWAASPSVIPSAKTANMEENDGQKQSGGLELGDGGSSAGTAAGDAIRAGRGGAGQGTAQPSEERAGSGGRRTSVKIPNHKEETATYRLMEVEDIQPSHLPESSFQKNPKYGLENERRYHEEPASRKKVLDNAADLDPAFLLESVDANHGAPVIDRQGNVLGGNGRSMSVRYAYDKFPDRAKAYRQALRDKAKSLGLSPEKVDAMRRPILVRELDHDYDAAARQQLVSALNDTFTDSKNARASGKSRGDRFSEKTLEALAGGLADADSLRQYFDTPESARVVELMINDGVIQSTERNAYLDADGLLNPDGKRVVEEALRGRIARSYDALASLPGPVLAKIDAGIPNLLIAEGVGPEWDITNHMRDAVDLLAEHKASGIASPEVFLSQMDMLRGKAPKERYSLAAQQLFKMALGMKKNEFSKAFEKYAAQAKISTEAGGFPGVGMRPEVAREAFFGIKGQPPAETGAAKQEGTQQQQQETDDVEQHSGGNLERDRGNGNAQDRVGKETLSDDGTGNGSGGREGSGRAGKELATAGGAGIPGRAAPAAGEGSPIEAKNIRELFDKLEDMPGTSTGNQALASLASRPARRPDSTAVQVVDVDSRIVPEFKRARDLAKWLKAYFEDKREETILSTGKRVRFSNGNLEASIKRGRETAHNQAYGALRDLVRQAEYDSFEGKDARHPNLGGQEIYYSALRIGDKLYAVKFKMDVPSEQEIKLRKAWRGESDPEDLRYKNHTLREIEIAPVLYRGVVPKSEVPTQITGAIDTVSLGVLRNAVNPSRIEEGTLASRPARRPDSLPSRFADMPTIAADSTQWFGPGKAIDADSRNMRKAVYDWARTAFPQGTTVDNADTGWRVQVTPSGIKASLHHGYDELLARSVPFIPQIIEGGIHVDSIRKTPQLLSHIFAGKIRLDEQDYVVGFVLREDVNGNRFYDHELTKIISPDWLKPGHPSNEGPSSEGSSGHRTNRGIPSDWLKPGPALQEGNVVHRTNRGDVMNILRERLGVNDGTGQVLFRTAGQFLPPKFKGRRAPSMEAVRRLADKMNGMAANAARVEIVENAGDLPQNLRDAYASQADSVEGLYDPATDTVWLVAANLESLERAAEVWLHENVVHHGLRSALAPAQRRLLLNQLWQIMGGMGNSSIRDIASRYGRDPRSNEAARLLIMEEALANLAERRARGMLRSTQEQSLWRRVVDAIVRAWNGMVYTLTGRRGRMGRSQMERLLDALQGHVMEGRPVAMPDAALQEGRLLYQDKKKSLAWARTNRLQLPRVRKLPARLSGKRILTEEDVVKPADPGRGGENTPLASLASRPSGLTESVASGIRALRKVMGRGVSADVEDILSNEEMGKLIPRHDLSLAERLFKLPHWVAKDHAGFAKVYDRQLRRVEERSAALKATLEQVPLLFDGDASKRLDRKEQEQLAAMIWKWDGKQIGPLNAIEKFNVVDQTVNGRDVLELNPDYQKKFRAWLKEQPEPERVKQAFGQVREALDAAFLRAYNKMAAMSDLAETDLEMYRTEFGNIHNYFPHQRTGKYFVVAKVGKETVFRKHFDVPFGSSVREEWAKIVAEHRKDFPDATWEGPREAQKLPDDILGAPIDPEAMEQIISAAASRLGDSEQAERVRSTLLSGVADVLKARGFGAHGIHRQNIPGFETQDVKGVLYSYMAGLNGWLTKMDAAADFARALGKIDASASPRLWEYAAQYTKDMLRNSDQIDRITGNIKSVAFAWYLGGNIKTAVVNLTQNAVVGVPRLQQYVTGGGPHWLKSAMDTIGLSYSGKGLHGAKKLTDEEAAMLQELYGNSVITDAYMEEVRGQVSASPSLRMWERFTRLLGWPMSKVEIFNRASLALAAYRAARVGAFKTKALKEYGLEPGQKMTHEQARDFAAMLVRDTHFEYGRGNQPEFLRSNVAGRMLSPVFTFRSFGANILNLWWRALLHEGKEGRAFVAKSLGTTVALGGLTAFPFYATLAALCAAASGDDEDWTTKVRNALPENNLLRDVVCYGLPSLLGVNIGGSLRMETPFTEGMKRGETFKEAMTESLGDFLGIPYDLVVNKPSKFLEARRFDADYRAVEALVPTFVANIMQAWRLATEGQTTMRGRPINSPGQPGARKLSTGEAFGKALGFQPTSSAKSYEAYAAEKRRTSVRSDRIDDFTNQALNDLESKGRPYMMRELRKKLQTWNKEMEAEGKPAMKIMPKDVLRRVAARRRENRPTRDQREKGAAQMATWGV